MCNRTNFSNRVSQTKNIGFIKHTRTLDCMNRIQKEVRTRMKKRFLISLLLSLAVIMPVMSVFADGPGPAIVIKGAYCGLMDADGNIFMSTCSHIVISNDKNGNTKLTCHATQPDYASKPLKAVLWNYDNTGLLCGTPLGATRDWMEVVTPSGKVTLVAHINPNPTP